ncbi:hypothetical protein EPIB1_1923 [Tritonibacter mobilis]|nr:hypothetical protein EPIB1_1923 [Tritonibacter mobilis]
MLGQIHSGKFSHSTSSQRLPSAGAQPFRGQAFSRTSRSFGGAETSDPDGRMPFGRSAATSPTRDLGTMASPTRSVANCPFNAC